MNTKFKITLKILCFSLLLAAICLIFASCYRDPVVPVKTYINDEYHVIIVMSNGEEFDAGLCPEGERPAPDISKLFVNSDYHLILEYTDGKQVDMGYVGVESEKEPVTISSTEVDANKNIIVKYSDGSEKNLGYVGVEVIKEVEKIVEVEVPIYVVKFIGKDGEILREQYVIRGKDATAPEVPEYEHFTFTGWNKDITNINSDLTVKAEYTEDKKHLVIFYDHDGAILSTQMVYDGEGAVAPEDPERNGFSFIGWDTDFSNVTGKLSIYAQYDAIVRHMVDFLDHEGNRIQRIYVMDGHAATAPTPPEVEGYVFVGWNKDFSCVTSGMTVRAIYEPVESSETPEA